MICTLSTTEVNTPLANKNLHAPACTGRKDALQTNHVKILIDIYTTTHKENVNKLVQFLFKKLKCFSITS